MNDISASDNCVTVITAFSGSLWLRWDRSSKLTEPVLNLFRKKSPSIFVFSQCITNSIFAGSRLMFTIAKKTTFSSRKLCWGTSLYKQVGFCIEMREKSNSSQSLQLLNFFLGKCSYPFTYGSVSAGREKWPFNVLFFLKVEPPCDQTWWDSLVFSILSCFSYVVHAENTLVGPVGPF